MPEDLQLLSAFSAAKGVPVSAVYSTSDMAMLFEVTVRTIQLWLKEAGIKPRRLPGRKKFLASDLEELLRKSGRK